MCFQTLARCNAAALMAGECTELRPGIVELAYLADDNMVAVVPWQTECRFHVANTKAAAVCLSLGTNAILGAIHHLQFAPIDRQPNQGEKQRYIDRGSSEWFLLPI